MDNQEIQEEIQEDLQGEDLQLEETVEEPSEFMDIAIYLYDTPDLVGVYAGVFGACLIAYMLFTLILRSVGGDD